jgi:twitching motility protein PilI
MTQTDSRHPLDLLRDLENRIRANALELPSEVEIKEDWVGIGFRLGDQFLVSRLGEVIEILTYPGFSRVPGAKDWVRGVANIRGNLLPVLDLRGYLHGQLSVPSRRSRVLVINHKGVYSGLIVDEVLGLKHFLPEQRAACPASVDSALATYVDDGFQVGEDYWAVFDIERLAEAPQFLQAAV